MLHGACCWSPRHSSARCSSPDQPAGRRATGVAAGQRLRASDDWSAAAGPECSERSNPTSVCRGCSPARASAPCTWSCTALSAANEFHSVVSTARCAISSTGNYKWTVEAGDAYYSPAIGEYQFSNLVTPPVIFRRGGAVRDPPGLSVGFVAGQGTRLAQHLRKRPRHDRANHPRPAGQPIVPAIGST